MLDSREGSCTCAGTANLRSIPERLEFFADWAISGLLDGTGELERRAQKHYDDTNLLASELLKRGYNTSG